MVAFLACLSLFSQRCTHNDDDDDIGDGGGGGGQATMSVNEMAKRYILAGRWQEKKIWFRVRDMREYNARPHAPQTLSHLVCAFTCHGQHTLGCPRACLPVCYRDMNAALVGFSSAITTANILLPPPDRRNCLSSQAGEEKKCNNKMKKELKSDITRNKTKRMYECVCVCWVNEFVHGQ